MHKEFGSGSDLHDLYKVDKEIFELKKRKDCSCDDSDEDDDDSSSSEEDDPPCVMHRDFGYDKAEFAENAFKPKTLSLRHERPCDRPNHWGHDLSSNRLWDTLARSRFFPRFGGGGYRS